MSQRVVIIGAGIVGAALARSLSRDGHHVTVVESGVIGGGATAAGMGHIPVMDDSAAQFSLCNYSQQLWEQLAPELPIEAEYDRCGTLWVAADVDEMAEVERKHQYFTSRGLPAEILDPGGLTTFEPNLRPGLAGGLRLPGDRVVYPPVATKWMLAQAQTRGTTLVYGTVTAIGLDRTVKATLPSKRDVIIESDTVIYAGGCGGRALIPGLEIRPRKGHLIITDRYSGFVHHQILELGYLKSAHGSDQDSVAFNVQPRPTGQLLLGSSRQFGVDHSEIDGPLLKRMIDRSFEYMPGLAKISAIRAWTGFRAATPDSLPLIGPHPSIPGLLLATGHEGLGITTAMGTAELIADSLAGRTSAIAPEPYFPSRDMAHHG